MALCHIKYVWDSAHGTNRQSRTSRYICMIYDVVDILLRIRLSFGRIFGEENFPLRNYYNV
jgi:hypothetical protein